MEIKDAVERVLQPPLTIFRGEDFGGVVTVGCWDIHFDWEQKDTKKGRLFERESKKLYRQGSKS